MKLDPKDRVQMFVSALGVLCRGTALPKDVPILKAIISSAKQGELDVDAVFRGEKPKKQRDDAEPRKSVK